MSIYLCVLDFEATCWENKNVNLDKQEIIEFPSVLYELEFNTNSKLNYIGEFSKYVRPTLNPILSDFCTKFTGITQKQVDVADTIDKVYEEHHKWLITNTKANAEIYIMTCGAWDIKTMLPKEIKNKKLKHYSVYKRYINIKDEFEYFYKKKSNGMVGMLNNFGLKLDGRHHSGIDDTKNIAKILIKMVSDSHTNFKINYIKY